MAEQIGAQPIPLRDPAGPWRGMTLRSKGTPGGFTLIENGYVSSDGQEIRTFPGYVCVIDPESTTRATGGTDTTTGYVKTHRDALRNVHALSVDGHYYYESPGSEQLFVWNRPTNLHCIEQVGGRWRIVGESDFRRAPILDENGAWCYISIASDNGSTISLTLQGPSAAGASAAGANIPNVVHDDNCWFTIWIDGITGDMSFLNGRNWVVTAYSGNVLTINTSSGSSVSSTGQTADVAIVTYNPANNDADIGEDKESLTVWTSLNLGDPSSSATTQVYPAHVFNRQRDFGDWAATSGGVIREGCANGTADPESRRLQKEIPYRLVPHVAGNRLIMAAPGYGCVFQYPAIIPVNYDGTTDDLGIDDLGNDIYDKPRSLGVPKCVQFVDNDRAWSTTSNHVYLPEDATHTGYLKADYSWGGPNYDERAGTYKFRFAYKDEATGEIGLWSEPIEVTSTASTGDYGWKFYIYHPGYLMCETGALSILVWRTKKNGSEYYYDRVAKIISPDTSGALDGKYGTKYGLFPDGTGSQYWFHGIYIAEWDSDENLDEREGPPPPVINEMPMGCKAARTIRGYTLFGGALGNAGSRQELQSGYLSTWYDGDGSGSNVVCPDYDVVMSRHASYTAGSTTYATNLGVDPGFGCAKRAIPTAYSGQSLFSKKLLPLSNKIVTIDKVVNTEVEIGAMPAGFANNSRMADVRYKIRQTPLSAREDYENTASVGTEAYLVLPRGKIWISEPDNPNLTPDTNITTISNELDQDVEAIGDMGGQAVVCTRNRTYIIGFSSSPIGAPPSIATDKFGCIAANSMVSYEGSCAWISDRGPVAMEGGFTWIGRDIETLFHGSGARYKRDTHGMMRHSWACHDAERSLLYFGVFADRGSGSVTVTYRGADYTWTDAYATRYTVNFDGESGGPFTVGETLTFSGGATAKLLRLVDSTGFGLTTGSIEFRLLTGDLPADNETFTGGTSSASASVNCPGSTPTETEDSDQILSRFPCDEVLIYSYRAQAWSVWRPPSTLAIQWMTTGEDDNGVQRVFFLGSDRRIYTLDDSFNIFDRDFTPVTITDNGATTTITVTPTTTHPTPYRVGVPVAIYSGTAPNKLKAYRTISAVGGSSITLDSSVTVIPGDKMIVGARKMTITSAYVSAKGPDTASIRAIRPKYDLLSLKSQTGSGQDQQAFASAGAKTVAVREQIPTAVSTSLTTATSDGEGYDWCGAAAEDGPIFERRLSLGSSSGSSHQVTMSFVGGAQVRLHQTMVEMQ